MRNGLVLSSTLHCGVVLATVYGLPQIWDPLEIQEQQIIVELVTVAESTTLQKPLKKDEKKERPQAPEIKKITKSQVEPNLKKAPMPQQKMAKLPPPPATEPPKVERATKKSKMPSPADVAIPKPKPPKLPKAKPRKLIAKLDPSKIFLNVPRPRSKPERKKPKFNAERIAALLDKDEEKRPQTKRKKTNWQKTVKELTSKMASTPERLRTAPLTMSEIDAIRYQIQRCWSIPAGARDAENLIIRIKVFLNTDGSLSKAPKILETIDQRKNPFYVAAAESALRAVLKCAPLKNLPVRKFGLWREITLTFNPREMLDS